MLFFSVFVWLCVKMIIVCVECVCVVSVYVCFVIVFMVFACLGFSVCGVFVSMCLLV